jgi:alpha-ribazole phosphatase/probable phosphoglycerate mutase
MKIYAGRSDEGLTEKGVMQVKEVSQKLKEYSLDALYSSPIQRTLQTADIIKDTVGKPYRVERDFREMELGPWEGLSEKDVARRYPDEWNTWNNRPADLKLQGRETLDTLLERVLAGVRKIHVDIGDGTAVVITHVAIIRVLLLWNLGKSLNLYKTVDVLNAKIFSITVKNPAAI